MAIQDSYFRVPEAAALLGVHPETIKRLCQRGIISGEKLHNTWLIPKDKFIAFSNGYRHRRSIDSIDSV